MCQGLSCRYLALIFTQTPYLCVIFVSQNKQQNKTIDECVNELSTTRDALERCKSQVKFKLSILRKPIFYDVHVVFSSSY